MKPISKQIADAALSYAENFDSADRESIVNAFEAGAAYALDHVIAILSKPFKSSGPTN